MANGYILKIPKERLSLFNDYSKDAFFAEPVPTFSHGRGSALVVFISTDSKSISHIASGRPTINAGTWLRRLNVEKVYELDKPLAFEELLKHVPANVRRHVQNSFSHGGILPPQSFGGLIKGVIDLDPKTEERLRQFGQSRRRAIESLPEKVVESLASQKEAVSTALHLAGMNRSPLLEWTPVQSKPQASFLEGLPVAYLREDAMIFNDLNNFPELEKIKSTIAGRATFQDETVRLDVIYANRTPLEEQTGTDLIYFNATYNSFVMVQYKAMEKTGDPTESSIFRLPSAQLAEEIQRMEKLLDQLMYMQKPSNRNSYRLNANPFYIKICPRIVLKPDEIELTSGMYFSLDHWKFLETDPDLVGAKGGRKISHKNVGRYLNNTEFCDLVKGAWIGTTASQSSMLAPIISQILQEGRATIVAIKSDKKASKEQTLDDF